MILFERNRVLKKYGICFPQLQQIKNRFIVKYNFCVFKIEHLDFLASQANHFLFYGGMLRKMF